MTIVKFDAPEDEPRYLDWLSANPAGFVVNTARPRPSPGYLKLHTATCRSISELPSGYKRFTSGQYQKVCSTDLPELERWARVEVGGSLDPCGRCLK